MDGVIVKANRTWPESPRRLERIKKNRGLMSERVYPVATGVRGLPTVCVVTYTRTDGQENSSTRHLETVRHGTVEVGK